MATINPIILSGGSGSRLWPLSRDLYPKQLLSLFSEKSLLQETVLRFCAKGYADPFIICNEDHRFIIAEQLRQEAISAQAIVLEPFGRNTAPAAAIAALMLSQDNCDALMLILPADHLVRFPEKLHEAVEKAVPIAQKGSLVTFGIMPDKPETGYGYIMQGQPLDGRVGGFQVERFEEKPSLEMAQTYLEDGRYLWNSGMFLFSASTYLEELSKKYPEMLRLCKQAIAKGNKDLDFQRLDVQSFEDMPSDSIDYAVMEHAENIAVIPVDLGWSDVGSWSALWEIGEKDEDQNVVVGDVLMQDVSGSYIHSQNQLVAALGLKDVVIVATEDAVLVAEKGRSQEVKTIIQRLKSNERIEHREHIRVYRPWGWYQTIANDTNFKVKEISVKPGASLSLQLHRHRAEHWVVVEGEALVRQDDKEFTLLTNQSTYIPIGSKHRLENKTDQDLRIVEVQTGSYLVEDDIERFEDMYGRHEQEDISK